MGQSASKEQLHQSKLIENLNDANLVEVLGYVNGSDTIFEVTDAISLNWSFSGKNVDKVNINVMCTFATQGQGKTELCSQLARSSSQLRPKGVTAMVAIPISFGQSTTINIQGADHDIEKAMVCRILFAFGIDEPQHDRYPRELRPLLDKIREANCPAGSNRRSVSILLMLDEVLKVKLANSDYFRRLLDMLCNLQQHDLRLGLPTFLLITSLEFLPVSEELTRSGWRLRLISLPIITDLDQDVVSKRLYQHLLKVLCVGHSENEAKKLKAFQNLRMLVRVAVSVSGHHFRTLENALTSIYKRVVSVRAHNLALEHNIPALMLRPATGKYKQAVDLFSHKGTAVDLTFKEVFVDVVCQIMLTGPSREMFEQAKELFLDLINFPDMEVEEQNLYALEDSKIVFVKSRAPDNLTVIVPRVNLPFLFMFPELNLSWQLKPSSVQQEQLREHILCWPYMRLMEPNRLMHHAEMLLYNIGQALSGPFAKLCRHFEDFVPFAELLTAAAKERLCTQSIGAEEILRGMVFIPRAEETLVVSSFVLKRMNVSMSPSSCDIKNQTHRNAEAIRAAVRLAQSPECDAVYVTQPMDLNTQCIEYVSRLFSVGQRQILCFCSMKLREKIDPVKIAEDIHSFVRSEVLSQCGMEDTDYYVILYCCVLLTEDIMQKLPRGTLVVGIECLRDLLYPFGLSPLILEAENDISVPLHEHN